ncbi:alpha/beta fold hydrolase [Microbacterium sp. BWT-B31]|uniref:esterase/lipase family protein n=1 Tax=Microbacterium sp. BWT-B31 TaxID=3232072 RepID=UPI003528555D
MTAAPPPVRRHHDEPVFFRADDGVALTLVRVVADTSATKGPVLLVHGAGMRAESFRPPHVVSIVDALIDDGWDVWMLNWRGSIDLDPRPWTLDDVAGHDIPSAVRQIVESTGAAKLKIVAHCQGAVAASMAAVAGLIPEVDVIVASGASLHPILPRLSRVKLHALRPIMQGGVPYIDVAWGDGPEHGVARVTRNAVRLWHAECRNPSCNMASFALGAGHPALWRHENLNGETHEWLGREFGKIPFSFYAQLAASDRAGQIVSIHNGNGLPRRFADGAPKTAARFALFAGSESRAFLPESLKTTFDYLERHHPGHNTLHMIHGYRYTDLFIGRHAHQDVFPLILQELNS